MEWDGSNVVITGASRGIGRAVALAAAARGARLGLIARSADELGEVLAVAGGRGAVATADVADADAVAAAVSSLEAEVGPSDILVANAGIGAYGPFVETDPAEAERLMRINYLGMVHAIHAVLPGMLERRRGHIVVVASVAGRIGAPFETIYSASKFAQVGLAEALATEVAPRGVGVSVVNPGPVATDFFATRGHPYGGGRPRPVAPARIAEVVMRAVERGSAESFVPRWLRPATAMRHLAPPLYRWGTRRRYRTVLG